MPFNHILFDICLSLSNASLLSKYSDGTSMMTRNTSKAVFNFKETFSYSAGEDEVIEKFRWIDSAGDL